MRSEKETALSLTRFKQTSGQRWGLGFGSDPDPGMFWPPLFLPVQFPGHLAPFHLQLPLPLLLLSQAVQSWGV